MEYYPVFRSRPIGFNAYLAVKRVFYYLCKFTGLFALAGHVTRRGLRIISYHGFSIEDECLFSPHIFMDPDIFSKRMQFIRKKRLAVLSLEDALELLERDLVPDRAIVITIDDGFYSTYRCAYRVLKEHNLPATIYVTTYYAVNGNPVFNLVMQYMFWKTAESELNLDGLGVSTSGTVRIEENRDKERIVRELIMHGENRCTEDERCLLAKEVGRRLGIDYENIAQSRILSIMNADEIRELSQSSFDIELHSHRHRFPEKKEEAIQEIDENRSILDAVTGKQTKHFCYPSGIWSEKQWPWLSEAGVQSAVTTDLGLNSPKTSKYGLKRFGDGTILSQIEFEAEISGFAEFLRTPKSTLSNFIKSFRSRRIS